MAFSNILVPYDGSEPAKAAIKGAIKLTANDPESIIRIIEVTAPPQDLVYSSINQSGFGVGVNLFSKEDFADVMSHRAEEDDNELSEEIAALVEGYQGNVSAEVIYGVYTVETIVDTAKDYGCDLIAMGSRGLSAIRGMIGSVSYGVLRASHIPILVVKDDLEEK